MQEGEIFGFLGPNGAGKTTTIRLLLDLLKPTSGNISLFNLPLEKHSCRIRQKCGYLPGDFSIYGMLTAGEFLDYAAKIRNKNRLEADSLIERFGFQDALPRKIKQLSHGTRQKLGIIQAFFHQPDLVILDEPTIGLDPLVKEDFYIFIREYQQSGKTIFFSSHNLPEVERICHRIAIIREGGLIALETIDNLKKKRFKRLKIELTRPVEELKIPGTRLINRKELTYEFFIESEVSQLMQYLAKLPLKDVIIPEPSLEEVFLFYYKDKVHD